MLHGLLSQGTLNNRVVRVLGGGVSNTGRYPTQLFTEPTKRVAARPDNLLRIRDAEHLETDPAFDGIASQERIDLLLFFEADNKLGE